MVPSVGLSQDEIYTKNGKMIIATIDTSTVKIGSTDIRYKERFHSDYKFINVESINFIRSWNGTLIYPIGVIVNSKSKKIHLPNVEHLPDEIFRLEFSNKEEAMKGGNKICSACFNESPTLGDIALEMELTRETVIAIQNENEIMYEHKKLPHLQILLDNIIENWPEKLKGYDYRIQIIRDNRPNAMAVAGGNLYFTTGLINMTEEDSELEAVMVHEVAHVERRHGLRGYKDYIKKQKLLAAAGTAFSLIAKATDSDDAAIGAAALTLATSFALEFSRKGYSRDLEQEADLFVQLYYKRKKHPINSMVIALDKFATHASSRMGFVPQGNAFSSHPDLLNRITQIKNGTIYEYKDPVNIDFHVINKKVAFKTGFLKMNINYIFWTPSSENNSEIEIIIAGTIINNNPNYSFLINDIILNFAGTTGRMPVNGLIDLVVPRKSEIDFVGRIKSKLDHSETIINSFKNNYYPFFGTNVSAVILKSGGEIEKARGMSNIKCSLSINLDS